MTDAGYRNQLARRQRLDHAPGLSLGEDVAVGPPYDQGWTGDALERGPQRGPRRGSDTHALPDILRIHLPDAATVGPLFEHAERQLVLILRAAARENRRHLAAVGHRVVEGRELVGPASDHLCDALAARLDVGTDVVDDQTRQTIWMGARVRHRDDAAHRGADQC